LVCLLAACAGSGFLAADAAGDAPGLTAWHGWLGQLVVRVVPVLHGLVLGALWLWAARSRRSGEVPEWVGHQAQRYARIAGPFAVVAVVLLVAAWSLAAGRVGAAAWHAGVGGLAVGFNLGALGVVGMAVAGQLRLIRGLEAVQAAAPPEPDA
jgi:hypothetical protein